MPPNPSSFQPPAQPEPVELTSSALSALEADFLAVHQDNLKQPPRRVIARQSEKQATKPIAHPVAVPKANTQLPAVSDPVDDETFLDTLAIKLAKRAGQFLKEPEMLEHLTNMQDLRKDNAQMAQQIHQLLDIINTQKAELDTVKAELAEYHPFFGALYVRISQ